MTLVEPALASAVLARALAAGATSPSSTPRPARALRSRSTTAASSVPRAGASEVRACGWSTATRPTTATSTASPRRTSCASRARSRRRCAARRASRPPCPPRPARGRPRDRDAPGRGRSRPQGGSAASLRRARPGRRAEVAQARIGYAESRRQVEVFNSEGRAAADDRTRVRLSAQVVARRDGRVETGTDTRGGHAGWELVESDPEAVAEKAARRALTLLDAVDAPTGRLPVVVGNGFGGVLLHEAVGHGLEADAVQKRASVYAGRLGEQLAEPFVTAYDDGLRANDWGSDGIDDEGTPTRQTTIIEDGRLVSYLYDVVSARKDRVQSTGNGRRESFRHLPAPRMTNTYFAPGETTPDELIAEIERGLYAVTLRRRPGRARHRRLRVRRLRGLPDRERRGHRAGARRDARRQRPGGPARRSTASRTISRSPPATAARAASRSRPAWASRTCASASSPSAGPRREPRRTSRARAVEAALAAGATDAEAWAEEVTSRRIRVYAGEVESLSDAGGRGVGVRAFVERPLGLCLWHRPHRRGRARDRRGRSRGRRGGRSRRARRACPRSAAPRPSTASRPPTLGEWSTERKVELALAIERAAR